MLQILKQIGTGLINGFPLVQSIIKTVKGVKGTLPEIPLQPSVDNPNQTEKQSLNIVSLLSEITVVCLIAAFVFNKISIEDLKNLIQILKNN